MATGLVCGARSGRYPLEIRAREPGLALTVHAYDAHQARKIREDLATAGARDIEVICSADLPEGRVWDRGFFFADAKLMPAELQLDCLQDMLAHVPGGEKANLEGVDKPTRRKVLARRRDFSAEWEASVPGGAKHAFVTLPGCFCHRRPDTGGLALAEVAAREVRPGSRVLDMGCGCGFVGLLVAVERACPDLVLVDSHARAVKAAQRNAARLGIAAACVLSDTGLPEGTPPFDVFLGNPPYYGDWKIAELFLRTAADHLKPGGVCYTVAKNPDGLKNIQDAFFPKTEIVPRRGYAVLKSVRP